jgi:hypothetical protein
MTRSRAHLFLALLLLAAPALVPIPAIATWIPLTVNRYVTAEATYFDVTDGPWTIDGSYIGPFDDTAEGYVDYKVPCEEDPEGCFVGSSYSASHQLSNFVPNGVTFSGQTGGNWYGPHSGHYAFDNLFHVKFRLLTNHRIWFYFQVAQGDWSTTGLTRGHIKLENAWGDDFYYVTQGAVTDSGFLAPGDYVLEARAWGDQNAETWQGAAYGGWFTCVPDTAPTLPYQPSDLTVGCGGTATFSVGTTCAAGTPTYQWRRNLLPLSNDARISGANGPTLTIRNACTADAGSYDAIVTCAGTSRPSSQARLTVTTTTTGVEPGEEPVGPVPVFRLRAPTPNPFGSSTAIAYEAARPIRVTATVYDARGAKVRTLLDDVASGTGAIRWNGESASGHRAPAGIYFVQVEGGGMRETKKVILIK